MDDSDMLEDDPALVGGTSPDDVSSNDASHVASCDEDPSVIWDDRDEEVAAADSRAGAGTEYESDDYEEAQGAYEFAGPEDDKFDWDAYAEEQIALGEEYEREEAEDQARFEAELAAYADMYGDPLDDPYSWSYHSQGMSLFEKVGFYLSHRAEYPGRPAFDAEAFARDWTSTFLASAGWTGEPPAWARAVVQLAGELERLIPEWSSVTNTPISQPTAEQGDSGSEVGESAPGESDF